MFDDGFGILRSSATGQEPPHQFLAGYSEVYGGLNFGPERPNDGIRCLRLFHGPREAVKHIATGRCQHRLTQYGHDQAVRDQVTAV